MVPKTLSTGIALDSLSRHSQGHKEIYFSCFDLPSCSFHERNPQRSPGVCGISASSPTETLASLQFISGCTQILNKKYSLLLGLPELKRHNRNKMNSASTIF